MKKFNTSPLSGMQEFLPNLQIEFDRCRRQIAEVFWRHGFQKIETPTIERTEILLAKAGGETEKQIYKVVKTAESASDADQALRFDHTVPLARYTVEHLNELAFPFRVTQLGRNFRGERPQKGRYREFYQCDIDVVGRNQLPVEYDAEVITTLAEALLGLPLPSGFRVRVSNRKLLTGLLKALNLEQYAAEIFNIVDHAEKVAPEKTREALTELGIGTENVVKITTFTEIRGTAEKVAAELTALGCENAEFRAGLEELEQVLRLAEIARAATKGSYVVEADMKIVRGLDYYTGTVFETNLTEYPEVGSICSGGRYENLASNYTEQQLPGVGGSIGLSRLFYILQHYGSVAASEERPVEYAVVPLGESEAVLGAASKLAERLRTAEHNVDVVWGEKKLGDKIKYAAKVARKMIVIGEDEASQADQSSFSVKDLVTGESETLLLP